MHVGETIVTREQKDRSICKHRNKLQTGTHEEKQARLTDPVTWHKKQPDSRTVDLVGIVIQRTRASR